MNREIETRLGFLGTGTIASAIVDGISAVPGHRYRIFLSPRNARSAATLASKHAHVTVAASNQEMIDCSNVVFLAVRPQIASEVLADARFRSDQRIINLIATFSHAQILASVGPATTVTCAVPLPTVSCHLSPTVIFPPDPVVATIFGALGAAIEVTTEDEFRALQTTTSGMGAYFSLLDTFANWLAAHRVERSTSHEYLSMMHLGLARVARESSKPYDKLAEEFKTKGGLNEQFAAGLRREGVFDKYTHGLDAILSRLVDPQRQP